MKLSPKRPPNFDQIIGVFPRAARLGVLFCYGDTIYGVLGARLSKALIAHEMTHSSQQGDDPQGWWDHYLTDPQFRLDAEVPAHLAEYIVERNGPTRKLRRSALSRIAQKLSSPLYRYDINKRQAIKLITNAEKLAQSMVDARNQLEKSHDD